ncbi:MAG: alpha/beta hydrolase, partial [Chloroflexota bacterium]
MRSKWWLIPVLIALLVLLVYIYPVPNKPFTALAGKVDPEIVDSLTAFRSAHVPQSLDVNSTTWEFIAFGEGDGTILFLHGMTGAADIWWQQMDALSADYHVISVTYPPVDSLAEMSRGVLAILEHEGVTQTNIVGSSLGGYLTQYLVAQHPDLIARAVFANTFPPNDLIAEKNATIGKALPYLPEWAIMGVLRGSFEGDVYTASGNSELVLAYMLEQSYGRMTKAQVVGRFHCIVDPFVPPDMDALGIPVMIIEADNDPLVEKVLREQLKSIYPSAQVHTLHDLGHFSYLNDPENYTD